MYPWSHICSAWILPPFPLFIKAVRIGNWVVFSDIFWPVYYRKIIIKVINLDATTSGHAGGGRYSCLSARRPFLVVLRGPCWVKDWVSTIQSIWSPSPWCARSLSLCPCLSPSLSLTQFCMLYFFLRPYKMILRNDSWQFVGDYPQYKGLDLDLSVL